MVQAVVNTCAPSLFHQWLHRLKTTQNIQDPNRIGEINNKTRELAAGLTFLSSSASFLLATVSLGENGWRVSQAMFGDIVTVFSVDEVSKRELEGDVCLTAQGLAIYAGPWRRSACVMATPPSQRQTIWRGYV